MDTIDHVSPYGNNKLHMKKSALISDSLSKSDSDRSSGNMAAIKRSRDEAIARDLASDVVYYLTKGLVQSKKVKPGNHKYSKTLRRTVDEVIDKHQILFKGMVNKLEVSEVNAHATIDNIANEMLGDGQFNWGRLVTLYAFTGLLAKHCAEHHEHSVVENIVDYTGDYVAENLVHLIRQHGGWDAFEDYFPEPQQAENTIWRGLLYTVVGLGALATMVSAR